MRLRLAPSILTADFGRMADEVRSVAEHVDWFHLDVMDGHYVPNITFGPSVVEAIRAAVDHPLHVHLMISDPLAYASKFADAGADRISFHPETTRDTGEVVEHLRSVGVGAGIAVHPDLGLDLVEPYLGSLDVVVIMTVRPGFGGQSFLAEVVPKIGDARSMVQERGGRAEIEVDGGVNLSTVDEVVSAGADIIVAGSAIFDGKDPAAAAEKMRRRLDALASGRTS